MLEGHREECFTLDVFTVFTLCKFIAAGDDAVPVVNPEPEPAEVALPEDFENEEKWASYPMNQAQSAFAQYRDYVSRYMT